MAYGTPWSASCDVWAAAQGEDPPRTRTLPQFPENTANGVEVRDHTMASERTVDELYTPTNCSCGADQEEDGKPILMNEKELDAWCEAAQPLHAQARRKVMRRLYENVKKRTWEQMHKGHHAQPSSLAKVLKELQTEDKEVLAVAGYHAPSKPALEKLEEGDAETSTRRGRREMFLNP